MKHYLNDLRRDSSRGMKMAKDVKVFGKDYACVYDFLYKDKDYNKECGFIQDIFRKYSLKPKTIIDLGCGTGAHALILAEKGFKVTGVDRSKEMLAIAKEKAKNRNLDIAFINQDVARLDIKENYDAVIAMFSVIGYQTDNNALAKVCANVKRLLNNNGIFIFDCWNGYAVLNNKPAFRVKEAWLNKNEKIIRFTEPTLDILNHTVETRFRSQRFKGGNLLKESLESHMVRFWFPQEIKYYLETAGFSKIDIYPFLELNKGLNEKHWNMAIVALAGRDKKNS